MYDAIEFTHEAELDADTARHENRYGGEIPTTYGEHVIDGITYLIGGLANIKWRSDCHTCAIQGRNGFAPDHQPLCDSKGIHCGCRVCWG